MKNNGVKKSLNKKLFLSVLILSVVLLSSFRVADDYVDNFTDEAIKNAAITYATARGINAIVSVLQTATIEGSLVLVTGSASIGELLDPINDLIERFSTVMTFVLGSLVAQKVLLMITTNEIFNHTIWFMGVVSILALYFRSTIEKIFAVKVFIILIFIRFSLGLIIGLNGVVDHLFLVDETKKHDAELKSFKNQFSLNGMINKTKDIGYFKKLESKVEQSVASFFNLMVLYLLKSIVFPLIFFYLLMLGIKGIWRSKLIQFNDESAAAI